MCAYYIAIGFITMGVSFIIFIFTSDALGYMTAGHSTPLNYWCVLSMLIGILVILAMTQLKAEHEIKCTHGWVRVTDCKNEVDGGLGLFTCSKGFCVCQGVRCNYYEEVTN